jgi:hypothetical protein
VSNRVELIHAPDCPNLGLARERLTRAFESAGLQTEWSEWNQAHAESPDYTRDYASPTILVDGQDVSADDAALLDGESCRLYTDEDGRLTGAPSAVAITAALQAAPGHDAKEQR